MGTAIRYSTNVVMLSKTDPRDPHYATTAKIGTTLEDSHTWRVVTVVAPG